MPNHNTGSSPVRQGIMQGFSSTPLAMSTEFAGAATYVSPSAAQNALANSVRIKLPIGDASIAFVESNEKMILFREIGSTSAEARRLKKPVTYKASHADFMKLNGRVKSAQLTIKNGFHKRP